MEPTLITANNVSIVKLDTPKDRDTVLNELKLQNLLFLTLDYISGEEGISNGDVEISSEDDVTYNAKMFLSTYDNAAIPAVSVATKRLLYFLKKNTEVKNIYVVMNEVTSSIQAAVVPIFEECMMATKTDNSITVYFEKTPVKTPNIFLKAMDYTISKEADKYEKGAKKDKKKKKKGKK